MAPASRQAAPKCGGRRTRERQRDGKWGRQERTDLPFPPTFQGAAMLGNWTSHPQRDQTRGISSVINSGPQLLWALIYLRTIPISRGSADHIGFPGKAWGKEALGLAPIPGVWLWVAELTTQPTSPALGSSFLPECS